MFYTVIRGRLLTFDQLPHVETKNLKVRATGLEERYGRRDAIDNPEFVKFETFDSKRVSLVGRQSDVDLVEVVLIT